jgi:protein involved in polysaccharide export with SLBB domain
MKLFHVRMVGGWFGISTAAALLMLLVSGCQSVNPAKTPMEMASFSSTRESKSTLGEGDILDFKFFYNPELNENQTIRPDGKITLQLVGEIMARGKTPLELQEEITKLYASQLRRPEATVIVRSFANRRVYVGGHVNTPGVIELKPGMTALEAIMQAGGFNVYSGEISTVVLVRHKDGKRYGCSLDFSGMLRGEETGQFYLEPLDIIYVPRTKVSQVNLWIDQYINLMIPRTGFTYLAPLGSGATIGFQPATTVITRP